MRALAPRDRCTPTRSARARAARARPWRLAPPTARRVSCSSSSTGGRRPRPVLARLLADALQVAQGASPDRPRGSTARDAPSDGARAAAAWIAASAQSRGDALRDLLLLADRLPARAAPSRRQLPAPALDTRVTPSLPEKILAIDRQLRAADIAHAFGGALALAYYAEPRATIDIDVNVFVAPAAYEAVAAALRPLGVQTDVDVLALARDGQCRVWWSAPRWTSSSPTTSSTTRCAEPRARCRSAKTGCRFSRLSTWSYARRCSTGQRTGWTSSRCSSASTISTSRRCARGWRAWWTTCDQRSQRLEQALATLQRGLSDRAQAARATALCATARALDRPRTATRSAHGSRAAPRACARSPSRSPGSAGGHRGTRARRPRWRR